MCPPDPIEVIVSQIAITPVSSISASAVVQGTQGPQGPQGPQGNTGPTGATGTLPSDYVISVNGQTGVVGLPRATTGASGIASFNQDHFTVNSAARVSLNSSAYVRSFNSQTGIVNFGIPAASYSVSGSAMFDVDDFSVNQYGMVRVTGNYVRTLNGKTGNVALPLATSSVTGVASFNSSQFVVSATGQVTINPALNLGGNVPLATSSVTGVASFNSSQFVVSATGQVTINPALNLGGGNVPLATSSVTGVASFNSSVFQISNTGSVQLSTDISFPKVETPFWGWDERTAIIDGSPVTFRDILAYSRPPWRTIDIPDGDALIVGGSRRYVVLADNPTVGQGTTSVFEMPGAMTGNGVIVFRCPVVFQDPRITFPLATIVRNQFEAISGTGFPPAGSLSNFNPVNPPLDTGAIGINLSTVNAEEAVFSKLTVNQSFFMDARGTGPIGITVAATTPCQFLGNVTLNNNSVRSTTVRGPASFAQGMNVTLGSQTGSAIKVTGGIDIFSGGLSVTGGINGTLNTASQPNVTSVGTLTSLGASGLITASGGLTTNHLYVTNGATFNAGINVTGGGTVYGLVNFANNLSLGGPTAPLNMSMTATGITGQMMYGYRNAPSVGWYFYICTTTDNWTGFRGVL